MSVRAYVRGSEGGRKKRGDGDGYERKRGREKGERRDEMKINEKI